MFTPTFMTNGENVAFVVTGPTSLTVQKSQFWGGTVCLSAHTVLLNNSQEDKYHVNSWSSSLFLLSVKFELVLTFNQSIYWMDIYGVENIVLEH